MDYHIFETHTLNSMLIDIDTEIYSISDKLLKLKEYRDKISLIIKLRKQVFEDTEKQITDDTLINP